MWQERQAELLRDEIEAVLEPLSSESSLYDLAKEPLTQGKRGLAREVSHDRPWPLLPLIACEAICGRYHHALPAAAARQFLIAAAEVFDDIEDADSVDSLSARHGAAVATNVATTLLILAGKAVTRLEMRGVAGPMTVRVMDVVSSFCVTACAGQHLDLSLTRETAVSEDMYLRVAAMKSAPQVEFACHIGALLANADRQLLQKFSVFGHELGMASQIANDIQGVTQGRDIVKGSMTLPAIYALAQTEGEVRHQLELAFGRSSKSVADPMRIRDLLFSSGAIHYATTKMEFHKQRASDVLLEVEEAGASVQRLRSFLG